MIGLSSWYSFFFFVLAVNWLRWSKERSQYHKKLLWITGGTGVGSSEAKAGEHHAACLCIPGTGTGSLLVEVVSTLLDTVSNQAASHLTIVAHTYPSDFLQLKRKKMPTAST